MPHVPHCVVAAATAPLLVAAPAAYCCCCFYCSCFYWLFLLLQWGESLNLVAAAKGQDSMGRVNPSIPAILSAKSIIHSGRQCPMSPTVLLLLLLLLF